MTPAEFAKFALDRRRLGLLGLLCLDDHTTAELAGRLGVDTREVLEWLGILAVEDLIHKTARGAWHLGDEGLIAIADRLPQPPPPAPRVFFGMTQAEGEVLARFTAGEQLTDIPVKRSHRLVVLERLALEFDPGRRYQEVEVNEILLRWFPDYARLRRALIDEGFMDRADGWYWRIGGRVELD